MTSEKYRKPDFVYFLDSTGFRHHKGTIVFGWSGYDNHFDSPEPSMEEPIISLNDIEAIMIFLHDSFPDGWEIKNGKVVKWEGK